MNMQGMANFKYILELQKSLTKVCLIFTKSKGHFYLIFLKIYELEVLLIIYICFIFIVNDGGLECYPSFTFHSPVIDMHCPLPRARQVFWYGKCTLYVKCISIS